MKDVGKNFKLFSVRICLNEGNRCWRIFAHSHWFLSFFFIALDEARDINTHLKPLRRYIEEIEQTEIPELSLMLPSLMHLIGLIWGSSSYYCSPQKIVVLLQEIGNLLVAQVCIEP